MSGRLLVLIVTLIGLSVLSFGALNQAAQSRPTPSQAAPLAVIDTILVSGAKVIEAPGGSGTTVTHQSVPSLARAGMLLYAGDEITTAPDTQMTILFLDNRAENQNEVEIDSNSRIQLGSLFTWLGRVIVEVRSRFTTKTPTCTYGVRGTEFELVVTSDGSNTMRVLEGEVSAQSTNISRAIEIPAVQFVAASFSDSQQKLGPQQQMDFVVAAGKEQTVDRDFIFTNSCTQKHTFQIRGPRNLEWFQLLGGDQFEINANSARTIRFAVRLDTRNVPAGTYEGEIIARCLDCTGEAGCNLGGLLLNVRIEVTRSGTRPSSAVSPTPATEAPATTSPTPQDLSTPVRAPTPVETASPAITSATATKLQQIMVGPKGQMTKTEVAADQISRTLQWSDGIIIASQPGYQAEGVVPHFSSAEERAATFREARKNTVLYGDATSYETLARVYVDWGAGAKAIESLKHTGVTNGDADHLVTLAEGYREMGRLDDAQQTLVTTIDQYPDSAPARVAMGNVFLDRAQIAKESKNYEEAKRFFELARDSYLRIVPAPTSSPASPTLKQTRPSKDSHARIDRRAQQKPAPMPLNPLQTVAESNLGQVYFALGDIAKDQKLLSDATANFQSAEQAFKRADNPASQYPFGTKGLGDVYREMGNVSVMKGDLAAAGQMRLSAQQKYREALGAHSDFAEAYVGFGNLLEDAGQKDDAVRAYLQATRVRPEQPAGFYYFAVAVADRNAQLAAAYSQAYLKAEKPTFRQGEKKENAERINQGLTPISRPAPVYVPPTQTSSPALPDNTPTVKVPGVKGDKPDEALKKLKKIGLEGRIEEQAECKATGKVLSTNPPKDSQAKVGQVIVLYVSGPGPDAVSVPNLIGMNRSEAEDELRRVNLSAKLSGTYPTNSYRPDTVMRQKPDARGNKLMPRCEVELTLAVAIPQVRVPNYIGMNTQDALRALPKYFAELVRGDVIVVDNGNAPPDTVVDQNPKPDVYVDRGSSVTLYVTRGGSDASGGRGYNVVRPSVPDVTKRSLQTAVNDLKNANLGYDISGEKGDYVVGQYPPPGTVVDPGYRVHLKLVYSNIDRPGPYIGPVPGRLQTLPVPKVTDMWLGDAKSLLNSKGLVGDYVAGDCNKLKVSYQQPATGTQVVPGTHVKLYCPIP